MARFLPGIFKSKKETTTQTSEPWQPQIEHLKEIFGEAKNIYENPNQGYSDQFTTMSPETAQALALQTKLANESAGTDILRGMLSPDYLSGQQFQDQFQAAANKLTPNITSQFARGGRARGGLAQQATTEALANAYGGLLGQQQDRQMQAINQLQGLNQQNVAGLGNVGAQKEQYNKYEQDIPLQKLMQYLGLIQGNYGSTQTMTAPSPSIFQQALGMGLAGGNMIANLMSGGMTGAMQNAGGTLGNSSGQASGVNGWGNSGGSWGGTLISNGGMLNV